ncbi:uncharacterized protein [Lolium perenne]
MEVALACCGYCPEHILKMESLSDDNSEKLLLQRIFVSGNQQLDNVSHQIKRNCGGLPLAIILVASLLGRQLEKLEQLGCMQNSFGANHTIEGFMRQILNISFNSLPHYLKTCLLYLGTYPEGFLFLKCDLVKQWVAEGFICAKEGEDMEEIAGSYFDELVHTGLIQVMDIKCNYEVLSYSMHHMVLDFISYKSIEDNFITVLDYSQTTIPLPDKVRRLSLHFGSATYATAPASTRLSQVRSLFFSGLFSCVPSFMVFKLLRVLVLLLWGDIGNTSFNLEGICELFWLRYLQVTCNVPVKLPDQIEPMKHLETLEIDAGVCAVPPDIVRLSNLLHLHLQSGTNLPDGVRCMSSLRTLMYFDLGNSSEDDIWGLGELTNLRDLHLTYSSSPSSEHLKKNLIALATILGKLYNLKSCTLASGTSGMVVLVDGSSCMYSTPVFLERLELPPICFFSRFPKWIGQLHKLCILKVAVRELMMNDIDSLTGLHSLKVLSLCVQRAPERRIVFNDGAFPVLKYFKFRCGVLYMSFMVGAMPNLRRLKLRFNTHIGEKYSSMLSGVEHLLNLQDISGRIWARTESDRRISESALKDAISRHPKCPLLNVKWVDPVEEDYHPSEKHHQRQEKGLSVEKHRVLEKAEDTNKHADAGLSQNSDLPSTVASRCLKSEETAEARKHHVLESMLRDESTEPKSLELSLLKDITNNFSDDREIGRSEFGVVYKGKLRNGSTVVVKRLAVAVDDKKFLDCVHCLMSVKHNNIVRFLGYCANTNENVTKEGFKSVSEMARGRLLCFEDICNGNLQMHLTDESCGFDWHTRYRIIKEICQGLHYLHDKCITHLDLKPGNILVDEKMVPKLVDCGYSRFLSEAISQGGLRNSGGSLAYMDTPEYLDGGAITYKSDIYSLGVIILQIVTGRNKKDSSNTVGVLKNWKSRLTLDTSVGDTLLETCCQQVKICIEIGMSCMDHDPGNRSTTRHIMDRFEETDITEQSVRSDVDSSYLQQMIVCSKATIQPAVAESKPSPATVAPESKISPTIIATESKASPATIPINTTPHSSLTEPKQNVSADDPHRLTHFPRHASPSPAKKTMVISPATMPTKNYHGSSFNSLLSSFGPLLLSQRDVLASASGLPAGPEAFQRHVAVGLAELRDGEGFLSVAWISRLLEAFLLCQEEFRLVVAHVVQSRTRGWEQAEKLVAEYYQRVVNTLDVCNAASEGFDKARRWERLASFAASMLLAPGKIHERQLRHSRKTLYDLSALLVDDAATAGGVASVASGASHCNRSFDPSCTSYEDLSKSPARFRMPHTWSAARQLRAIGSGLVVPRRQEAGLAAPVYAMICVLHLVSWVLVAAIPYPDSGATLHADHLPVAPLHAAFPWAFPLLALQQRLTEEGKRKDRHNFRGLLKEIHTLEKCAQRLAEAIDSAPILLAGEMEAMVRETAAELAAVCAAMKDGLEPLERQVRKVYRHIVRCRDKSHEVFELRSLMVDLPDLSP